MATDPTPRVPFSFDLWHRSVAKRFMSIRMAGEGSVPEGPDWKKIGMGGLAVLVAAKFMTEVKTSRVSAQGLGLGSLSSDPYR